MEEKVQVDISFDVDQDVIETLKKESKGSKERYHLLLRHTLAQAMKKKFEPKLVVNIDSVTLENVKNVNYENVMDDNAN
jgi:hypothetical protein